MRCTAIIISALAASVYAVPLATSNDIVNTAAIEAVAVNERSAEVEADNKLDSRGAASVLSSAGSAAAGAAISAAVSQVANIIKALSDWTQTRERFTQDTVAQMMQRVPSGYVGAVCCNVDYKLDDASKASGATKARLSSSSLHTDYDCMYLAKGASWTRQGDGGYINWAWNGQCSYNSGSSTLTC